jgi:hypothetical protein
MSQLDWILLEAAHKGHTGIEHSEEENSEWGDGVDISEYNSNDESGGAGSKRGISDAMQQVVLDSEAALAAHGAIKKNSKPQLQQVVTFPSRRGKRKAH